MAMLAPIDGWPKRSVAGDGSDERRHLFGFLALVEQRGHLPEPAGAAFGDGTEHERLASRGGGDVDAHAYIEVRAHAPNRLGGCERVADGARLREQLASLLLFGGELDAADRDARLVRTVERKHERWHGETERDHDDHAERDHALPQSRFRVQPPARPPGPSRNRTEEDAETENRPHDYEHNDHARGKISGGGEERSIGERSRAGHAEGAGAAHRPRGEFAEGGMRIRGRRNES